MTYRGKAALAIVSLAVAPVISAPTASARPTCQNAGPQTICETRGSVSIKARPGTTAPPATLPVVPWGRGTRGAGAGR